MPKRTPQLHLELVPTYGWGGERPRAGRKPTGDEPGIPHRSREDLGARVPLHVTLRARSGVPNLRTPRFHRVIAAALRGLTTLEDFRVVHFSLQANHLHLIVEADGATALGNAMRALSIRLSRRLNVLLGTRGRALEDRYHAHALRTPAEVRNAVAYVIGNFASHAQRRGENVPSGFVDTYSSAAVVGPDGLPPPASPPRTWLLATRGVVAREPEATYALAA